MRAGHRQAAHHLAGGHDVPGSDRGGDRLVRRAEAAVVDDHHPDAGERAGEGDGPAQRRADGLPHAAQEVHAAVPGRPALRGRIEGRHHHRRRLQRPRPLDRGRRGRGRCPGGLEVRGAGRERLGLVGEGGRARRCHGGHHPRTREVRSHGVGGLTGGCRKHGQGRGGDHQRRQAGAGAPSHESLRRPCAAGRRAMAAGERRAAGGWAGGCAGGPHESTIEPVPAVGVAGCRTWGQRRRTGGLGREPADSPDQRAGARINAATPVWSRLRTPVSATGRR